MTPTEFRQRLPKHVRQKIPETTVEVWLEILLHVVDRGQTSRYDDDLRKRVTASTGEWISDSALKKHLKNMADVGLLQPHRVVFRYTEVGKAMLPLFGFFRGDGPPPGAHMAYTLPGMNPNFDRSKERNSGPRDAAPGAAASQGDSAVAEGPASAG